MEALHGLQIVVEDVGGAASTTIDARPTIALEIGDEHFDGRRRGRRARIARIVAAKWDRRRHRAGRRA
jgi:hypothetical protein